ncbi:hypothetical protein ACFFUS_17130 [Vibrio gallaecicus]|uniref:hypothetical protein n=1 Tax=Vibrio gallaecicus TaxID=552386 RepID=UPI0010C9F3B7|nr:hypothetical protein [Vibrio gallaecicus]MDN3617393.1 hypothetical protein [Vibrio gallaecicus]
MILNISDEVIDFRSSKWIVEYAFAVGCNKFSVDFDEKNTGFANEYQRKLIESLAPFFLGEENAPIIVSYNNEPYIRKQKLWELNHDSTQVIVSRMGAHLLDDLLASNEGVSGWRFFKDDSVIACAVHGFDYLFFLDPPSGLIEKLGSKASLEHT